MKKLIVVACLIFLFVSSGCTAQEKKKTELENSNKNQPKTNIVVNKEYDKNGNLIKYDSTYSSIYSNIHGDSTLADTSFLSFQKDFMENFPDMQKPFIDNMFFNDSLLNYDFYKKDFFTKRFQFNRERFDKLFEKMDSLKNDFYKNNIKSEKKSKNKTKVK
jgi:hypothetical protein